MASLRFRSPYNRLLALWVLRAIAPGLGRSRFIKNGEYGDRDIAEFLGLPLELDADKIAAIPRMLNDLQLSVEKAGPTSLPQRAKANLAKLAASLKLTTIEERLVEFFVCKEIERSLADTWLLLRGASGAQPSRLLAKVLGLPQQAVLRALSPGRHLMKCGLIKISDHPHKRGGLEFHSPALAAQLFRDTYAPSKMLKSFGVITPPHPQLALDDYPQLQPSLDLLLPYLKMVRSRRKVGVNILLHGQPGTGKTQLTRVLARAVGVPVYELDTSDEDGDPLRPVRRLGTLNLAQTYFQDDPVLLVFDEAEDVLAPSLLDRGTAGSHKGWFNQMLETNRQPVFWISNSISSLDPAFSRRFDFVLEVPIPPKAQRRRILREKAGNLVSPGLIEQLAGIEHLAPAVVTRARNFIQSIRRDIPKDNLDAALTHVIGGTLKAQGYPDPARATIQVIQPGIYDISHLNTSADLQQIAVNLRKSPSARLCLYGPPGTGKTSFGHWLANEIGQPLFLRKASDLLSPYVGVTERMIARTFEAARQDGAVLLIDEVDSFLRDRTQTRHSWEVTQINEMLTQIESFPGILIASTNLIDQLDPASMRRFDIKLHFGYLLPEQASRLFVSYCENLDLPQPTAADLNLATTLDVCAPGDFAAVARQHRFQPFREAGSLLQAVIAESEMKANRSRRIGFQ